MGLIIFLRKQLNQNKFRNTVISSINTGEGNSAILCSGFYQENWHRNPHYEVSTEGNFDQALINNNISLTTYGVYNYTWLQSYKNFRNNLRNKGININAKRVTQFHWHAKIFILKMDDRPILGIVGSSNMTRNAFGLTSPFNFEADVIMWLDDYDKINKMMTEIINESKEFPDEIIVTDYDPMKNNGQSIEDRLRRLENDLKEVNQVDLEE